MIDTNLQKRFAWHDLVQNGKYAGWGWVQTCTVLNGRVLIECIKQPVLIPDRLMKLHVVEANHVTLIDYTDTGFMLMEYAAKVPFDAVIQRLQQVRSTPVHLVATELLDGLAKDGLLAQLFGNHRRCRGQLTH